MRPVLLAALLMLAPWPVRAEDVVVFAAASLKTALDEVAQRFTADTGYRVTAVYAGSNILAAQIIQGAPADLFLSADPEWMDQVERNGLALVRADLVGNRLALIAHGAGAVAVSLSPATDLPRLLDGGKLAMALVDAVPAGRYGKAALESLGLWNGVEADVAQADNARAALALVATGEAPLGIVYATDALAENDVTIIAEFPPGSHPAITYPAALLTTASDNADRAFFDALWGDEARAIFQRHGFLVSD